MIALLADACWPLPGAKQRTIVQKLPLVPHQGYTQDCGVFTVIYFAGLFFQTDTFLAAFEPRRRLTFPENLAKDTRTQMLEWST
jgi:Ulp1 family protease